MKAPSSSSSVASEAERSVLREVEIPSSMRHSRTLAPQASPGIFPD
jgi:hypothetical protein